MGRFFASTKQPSSLRFTCLAATTSGALRRTYKDYIYKEHQVAALPLCCVLEIELVNMTSLFLIPCLFGRNNKSSQVGSTGTSRRMGLPSGRAEVLPGQPKTFPSTAPDIEVIEVSIASRLEISSLGHKASRPIGGR